MKIYTDCYACLAAMSLRTLRYSGANQVMEREIMQNVMGYLSNTDDQAVPVDVVAALMDEIREKLGVDDPYEAAKQKSTQDALSIYPKMKEIVSNSKDPFRTAIHLGALGNAIDFGVCETFDLEAVLSEGLKEPLYDVYIEDLRKEISQIPWLLMMADNAGESVFDRVLIETIHEEFNNLPITYVVKSNGGLNDTMLKDAVEAGLDQCTTLVETGDGIAGIILARASEEFSTLFESAPLILSKGVGNYEGLSGNKLNENLYYLFKVKCNSMVREIGLPVGSLVLWHYGDEINKA